MSTPYDQKDYDLGTWIVIIILFAVGLWPVSLFLLARKLLGLDKKKSRARHPYDIQREKARQAQQSAQSAADQVWNTAERAADAAEEWLKNAREAAGAQSGAAAGNAAKASAKSTAKTAARGGKKTAKKPELKFPRGRGLTTTGAILSGIFGFSFLVQFVQAASWGGLLSYVTELVSLLGFLCLGLVLMACGIARTRKGKRWRKYVNLIGTRSSVSITALAKTSGIRRGKVMDDLQDMLDAGLLPTGYLDLSRDLLVISEAGIPDEPAEARAEPEPPQDDYAVLAEIRAVNDAIPDPVMSEKIDRIGEITGKILDYQRQNPGKDGQLRSFLNYYLPTTLKILRSYAQLDAQGVEGENISAAKQRIEGMMDKVVGGFENQLDQLFADSAMDISSDVAVLEQMLEKDGLSGGQGMTMGG